MQDWNKILRDKGYSVLGAKFGAACQYAVAGERHYRTAHPSMKEEIMVEVVLTQVANKFADDLASACVGDRLAASSLPFTVFEAPELPLDFEARNQMLTAARMHGFGPDGTAGFVGGAIMADGHPGYGLPVGGVAAYRNYVFPNAVGPDIGCMVHAFFVWLEHSQVPHMFELMQEAVRFGSADHDEPQEHAVLSHVRWRALPADLMAGALKPGGKLGKRSLLAKAAAQLGTLGGGNHFFDLVRIDGVGDDTAGLYAIVSHAGSRGVGGAIADYYCALAAEMNPDLPPKYAGFLVDSPEGQGYINAMRLAMAFAVANHQVTAARLLVLMRERLNHYGVNGFVGPLAHPFPNYPTRSHNVEAVVVGKHHKIELQSVWNHHNYAAPEMVNGELLWVHRKGATPAQAGALGLLGGSCGDIMAFVVGKGDPASYDSGPHGAGRGNQIMPDGTVLPGSRTNAKRAFKQERFEQQMAGILYKGIDKDENPAAYKPLAPVLAAHASCFDVIATGSPVAVLMAGETADDGE